MFAVSWKKTFLWLVVGTTFAVSSCGFKQAPLLPPPALPAAAAEDGYVILLLIDGARPKDLDQLVAEGRLPNFRRLFYDQGARFQNALAVIPTASTPSHQSFVSGLFPGNHGIPSLDWFDRVGRRHIDYLKPMDFLLTPTFMFNFKQVVSGRIVTDRPQLIYRDLKGLPTMTVMETAVDGASLILPKHPPALTSYRGKVEKFYEQFDLTAMQLALARFRKAAPADFPRFSFLSFYGMDLVSHFDGLMGERMRDLYLQHDRFLGELERLLRDRGIWEKTTIVLLSDHGQHELKRATDLSAILKRAGVGNFANRPEGGRVMYGDHGLAFSNLYFKMGKDWLTRPTYADLRSYPLKNGKRTDLIAGFSAEPDIEWVVAPDGPWRIHLHRKSAHAVIERRNENGRDVFAYLPDPGADPLEYLNDPRIASWTAARRYVDAESWLEATKGKAFPDAVVLLFGLFPDYRAGDLLLFTGNDTQFKENRRAGHGSFLADDLNIVLMFHGRKIRPGVYGAARSVDVYPILLALFGLKPQGEMDGVLRPELFGDLPAGGMPGEARSKGGMTVGAFRERLSRDLRSGSLDKNQKAKAAMLLFAIEQYERDRAQDAPPAAKP